MENIFENLLIGIIGGVFSGIIVSRVFMIREYIDDQVEVLKNILFYTSSLDAFFVSVEIILKRCADSSIVLKEEIPESDGKMFSFEILIMEIKAALVDKSIKEIKSEDKYRKLEIKEYKNTYLDVVKKIEEINKIETYNFENTERGKDIVNNISESVSNEI